MTPSYEDRVIAFLDEMVEAIESDADALRVQHLIDDALPVNCSEARRRLNAKLDQVAPPQSSC